MRPTQMAPECLSLNGYAAPLTERPLQPRGRPKTRTDEHYVALVADYQRIAAWFSRENGRAHRSDNELLAAYFTQRYEMAGLRRSRVAAADFAGRMKTLRNELSRARARLRDARSLSQETGF